MIQIRKFLSNDLIFIAVFVVFASFYYDSVLTKGPLNAHLWRQTDCLSLARNYAAGAKFLEPEMDVLLADDKTSGKSAGELPLLYFTVGKVWAAFGESYFSYRVICLIILFFGVFAFYKALKLLLNSNFWAAALAALLFTSPVYVFYGISFLTDAPAFSIILIALYFFIKYFKGQNAWYFYISMVFFSLAGLLKISSLISFLFLFSIFILEVISPVKLLGKTKLYNRNRHEWLGFLLVFVSVFSWYYYASYYNGIHGFKYTFNSIYPFWIMQENEVSDLIKGVRNFTGVVYFSKPVIYSLLFLGISNLFIVGRVPLIAYLANIVIIIGSITYFLLWAPLMGVHDYYYTALLVLFIGVFIPFIWFIKSQLPALFSNLRTKIFFSLFVFFNFMYCLSVMKLKTFAQEGDFIMISNQSFITEAKWQNWDVDDKWKRYEKMKPYLEEIGVKPEDKIISLPDPSLNTSLFLSGHRGWTGYPGFTKTEDYNNLIEKGAKYLFIGDSELLEKEYLEPLLSNQIGEFRGILIFKLN